MGGGAGDEVVEVSCGGDPGAYAAVLKRKLDLYCAAVAKSMEAKSQESSLGYPNSQASDTSQLISPASFDGDGDGASPVTNSNVIDNADFQGKPANSGTSREQSDDDGNLEENSDPANAKKMRRMLSNRESARRSRNRKQAHLNDLESQVSSLTADNASLLKRLADMTQKYKDSTLENRNLIVDVETMRRKVNIAEEAVRRVTGITLLLSTTSNLPASSMPLTSCMSEAASAALPIEESMKQFFQAPLQDDQIKPDQNAMPSSMRRVASLENLEMKCTAAAGIGDAALFLLLLVLGRDWFMYGLLNHQSILGR